MSSQRGGSHRLVALARAGKPNEGSPSRPARGDAHVLYASSPRPAVARPTAAVPYESDGEEGASSSSRASASSSTSYEVYEGLGAMLGYGGSAGSGSYADAAASARFLEETTAAWRSIPERRFSAGDGEEARPWAAWAAAWGRSIPEPVPARPGPEYGRRAPSSASGSSARDAEETRPRAADDGAGVRIPYPSGRAAAREPVPARSGAVDVYNAQMTPSSLRVLEQTARVRKRSSAGGGRSASVALEADVLSSREETRRPNVQ